VDEKLIEAYWHAEHRLFGRKLRPLTLRHCFVLATAGNPIIEGGAIPTTADLIQAVEICSRPGRFFLTGKRPNWLARQAVAFMAIIEKRGLAKFAAYLADYASSPDIWQKEGAKSSKMHWTMSVVGGLGHWCGIKPEDAWEMSPGEAQWTLAAAIDQSATASIDLVTNAEREAIARLKAREVAA
jgi:hypothetical protein